MARLLSHSCTVMFGISSGIYKIHHLRIVLVLSSVLALTAKSSCFLSFGACAVGLRPVDIASCNAMIGACDRPGEKRRRELPRSSQGRASREVFTKSFRAEYCLLL